MRAEFWDTAPAFGGDVNMWAALQAAAADPENGPVILSAVGVLLPPSPHRAAAPVGNCSAFVTVYDERGRAYELPAYVLSDPVP